MPRAVKIEKMITATIELSNLELVYLQMLLQSKPVTETTDIERDTRLELWRVVSDILGSK